MITTTKAHGFQPGDRITIRLRETRRWVRFWYWVTSRPCPERVIERTVSTAAANTVTYR